MAFVMREAIGSEERFEQLAMRVWPLLEARSPAWKFFQTVPEAPPRPSSEWTEEAFAQQASLRAAASRGS
jgi:hypothetical protein